MAGTALWLTLAALAMTGGSVAGRPAPVPARAADSGTNRSGFAGFVDQSGRRFDPARLAGRPVLLNFIFAGCGTTCPLQTAELAATLAAMPARMRSAVRIVSVTVDPRNDSPAVLLGYARKFGAPPENWAFLTGNEAGMRRLLRTYLASGRANGLSVASMHSTDVLLVGGNGRVLRRYRALPLDRGRLIQDLDVLARFPALQRGSQARS